MFGKIRKHFFRDVTNRLNDLETAIHVLVDSPAYRPGERVGFNGLAGRKRIFEALLGRYRFACFIETGTHVGNTTGYLSEKSNSPVYSSEINPILYSLAAMRLRNMSNIHLHNMDSTKFLEEIARDRNIVNSECFFYLDAHWRKNSPLLEEIAQIASRWDKFAIMIDDFQVPGDEGYGYDRYGAFKKLNISLIRPVMKRYDLRAFFPNIPSAEESVQPKPRGFVILTRDDEYSESMETIPLLRRHEVD